MEHAESRLQCLFRGSNHARMADEKDDESKRLAVFFRAQNIAAGKFEYAAIRGTGAKLLDGANHGDMMQRATCIFSVGNFRMGRVLCDDGEHRGFRRGRGMHGEFD